MAENTYTTLKKETITVTDKGITLEVPKPEWLPTDEEYESPERLEEWARQTGFMHAILQSGIRQEIIALRAAIRPSSDKQSFEIIECIERSTEYEPKVQKRPQTGGKKQMTLKEMIVALKASGMTADEIKAAIGE